VASTDIDEFIFTVQEVLDVVEHPLQLLKVLPPTDVGAVRVMLVPAAMLILL
jgi:hypothetical protein